MVKEIRKCETCRYSTRDYIEYVDKDGRTKIRVMSGYEFVRCNMVKILLRNKNSGEPVRVPNHFAYCCPFYRSRYGFTKVNYIPYEEIDEKCSRHLYVKKYGINSIPMDVILACGKCGREYRARLVIG